MYLRKNVETEKTQEGVKPLKVILKTFQRAKCSKHNIFSCLG